MESLEKTKERLVFMVDTNESLANAIRRSSFEIPIVAIDEVEFHKNDSALYDEIIAHRLGLIPIKENRKLNEPEKCSCEGKKCNKCQIQISMKAVGPTTVHASDLKGDVEVIFGKMPIVILEKDQAIQSLCFARLGKAVNHAKYSSGLFYYRNVSEVNIKNNDVGEKIISKLNNSLINAPKGKIKSGEIYQSSKDTDYIETLTDDKKDSIEVKTGKEIIFFIESWGQKNAKDIFIEAVNVLYDNLKVILKEIKD